MTTVASGFCTSAPTPCAIAIGTKPIAGHEDGAEAFGHAVMDRGVNRHAASNTGVDRGHDDETVQDGDAGKADEADRR